MIVYVNELSGAALDWAVAKCEKNWVLELSSFIPNHDLGRMNYSTDWSQGGPILEREHMHIDCLRVADHYRSSVWEAWPYNGGTKLIQQGPTPLIAAMRCYIASKLGDSVDVPDELL